MDAVDICRSVRGGVLVGGESEGSAIADMSYVSEVGGMLMGGGHGNVTHHHGDGMIGADGSLFCSVSVTAHGDKVVCLRLSDEAWEPIKLRSAATGNWCHSLPGYAFRNCWVASIVCRGCPWRWCVILGTRIG